MFEHKVVIITGAAQGLGLAMATRFCMERAAVVLSDIDAREGPQAVARLKEQGYDAHFMRADVTVRDELFELVGQTVRQFGKLDVMVNNAGLAMIGPSESVTEQEWDLSIDVMQKGVFFGCQAAGSVMIGQRDGVILNISSINAVAAFPMRLAYCAAKAAVSSMTRVLAIEWAEHRIRVNAIAPGVMKTNMVDQAIREKRMDTEGYLSRIPMRRLGEPHEVADACLFLCSPHASYITGEVLTVDGGWTANGYIS